MKIGVTGSSGFIGSYLLKRFNSIPIPRTYSKEQIAKLLEREGINLVVNLAGKSIFGRWNSRFRREILSSRLQTTQKIVWAVDRVEEVKMFISVSGTAIYPENRECGEECGEMGKGFLADVVKEWEKTALQAQKPTAILRLGVVLGQSGGFLERINRGVKLGVVPIIGDGNNFISYIHIEEVARVIQFLFEDGEIGVFNLTTPNPVQFSKILTTIEQVTGRRFWTPKIPPSIARFLLGKVVDEVFISSQKVYPHRLLDNGYRFQYPTIESVISSLYKY